MTTTIITNLIGPMCELYYKTQKEQLIQQQLINSFRNYNLNQYDINFGFEIQEPILNIFQPTIQQGVFTSNYTLQHLSSLNVVSNVNMPDVALGSSITYVNKTLPIIITLKNINGIMSGVSTAFLTNGVPYVSSSDTDNSYLRIFENYYTLDTANSFLIFYNLNNVTFKNNSGNISMANNSLFTYKIYSYRTLNSFGDFNSLIASQSFSSRGIQTNAEDINSIYQSTYAFVYNWKNKLTWPSGFSTWYAINKNTINIFTQKFLSDYFGL